MFSAGQYYGPNPTQPPQGYGQPTSQYYGPPQPQTYGGIQPTPNPWGGSSTSTTGATIKIDGGTLQPGEAADYLNGQTELAQWGLGANTLNSLCNSITSWVALAQQGDMMDAYYNYMNKVADNGMTVALEQLHVQEKSLDYARILAEEQQDHEVKLARLDQALQVKLARVAEQGKTDRAGIYMASNAFSNSLSASDYFYGSTIC